VVRKTTESQGEEYSLHETLLPTAPTAFNLSMDKNNWRVFPSLPGHG